MSKAEEFSAKSEGCKLQHFSDLCCLPFTFGDSDMVVRELISKLKNGKYISDTIHSESGRDTLSKYYGQTSCVTY